MNIVTSRTKKPQVQSAKQRQKAAVQSAKKSAAHNTTAATQSLNKTKPSGPNPLKRGQKAKMKRIKEKYADQDEEERQIRQQILQGANAKLSAVHELAKGPKKEKAAVDSDEENESETEEQKNEQLEKEQRGEDGSGRDDDDEGSSDSDEEGVDTKEKKVKFEAHNTQDIDREEDASIGTAEVSTLETLTGLPTTEDTILYALPFCAPFSALQNYKYKAKLIPGTQKRGKSKQRDII